MNKTITINDEDEIANVLRENGFNIFYDGKKLILEPSFLKLRKIKINRKKIGMHKVDPSLCPEELRDDNIYWRYEIEAYATTEGGEDIPIHLIDGPSVVEINEEVVNP